MTTTEITPAATITITDGVTTIHDAECQLDDALYCEANCVTATHCAAVVDPGAGASAPTLFCDHAPAVVNVNGVAVCEEHEDSPLDDAALWFPGDH